MLTLDTVIALILSVRQDLTREEIQQLIHLKKEEASGLLTDEGATYMVANDLGVRLSGQSGPETHLRIKDIVMEANDATVTGRILLVYPLQTFTRSDGSRGKVVRLILADETGVLRVVVWDDKTDPIAQGGISQGHVVKVLHGYVRSGLDGKPELNVGSRGEIVVLPPDASTDSYPTMAGFFTKVGEMKEAEDANIIGIVTRISAVSSFARSDGLPGKVMRLELADETGRVTAVVWDEMVEQVEKLRRSDCLQVMGARTKRGLGGRLELHIDKRSQVKLLTERPPTVKPPPPRLVKVDDIKPDMVDIDVLARVMHVGPVREFKRASGELGQVADLTIKDETGFVRLTLWDKHAEAARTIAPGDVVFVEGAYARTGQRGIDLNLGGWGVITVNPSFVDVESLPPTLTERVPVGQLKIGLNLATVEGSISESPVVREVALVDGRVVKVASFLLRDESGEVRVSVWRDLVDKVSGLREGARVRVVNAYVRAGGGGGLELSTGYLSAVEVLAPGSPD